MLWRLLVVKVERNVMEIIGREGGKKCYGDYWS